MKKNNYKYRSGNILNINKLKSVTGSFRSAQALDQFAFYSINSSFILPKKEVSEGWFRIGYEAIAKHLGYQSARSITSLIKKLIQLDLIEKIRPLIGGTNKACLRITVKTKAILNLSTSCEKLEENITEPSESDIKPLIERKNFDHNFTSESEKISLAYNNDKKIKEKDINIITPLQDCGKQEQRYNVPNQVELIFKKIGERLTENQKTIIWGAICNLQKHHRKKISNIAEFTAWISFSILNANYQIKSTTSFEHQLNKLMKIARSEQGLQKPRGFYNHWDIGRELKQKEADTLSLHVKRKRNPPKESLNIDYEYTICNTRIKNEIWQRKADLSSLKTQRADLLSQINALIGDLKTIAFLFSNNPDELKRQKQINKNKIEQLKQSLILVEEQIEAVEQTEKQVIEAQWQPLYAAR